MAVETQTYQGSQQQYGVVIDHDVIVPARDGTPLATSIYYPALHGERAPGRFPALMERTPYDRHRLALHLAALFFARHGYVTALQDIRGRGDSGGEYRYLYNYPTEADDGYDAVEWLAAREWSDGQVGTFGISHTGATQQALAVARPPHLTCQVVGDAGWNYFQKGTQRNGGALTAQLAIAYPFRMARTSPAAQRDHNLRRLLTEAQAANVELLKHLPLRRGQTALRFVPTYEEWYFDTTTRGTYDEYWRNPGGALESFVDDYADVPLFFFTSWYGHHPHGNFVKYNALRKRLKSPIKLVSGIWIHGQGLLQTTHAGEVDFGLEAALGDLNSIRLMWFDQFMKGYDTGLADGPPIEIFVMGGGSGLQNAEGRMEHGGSWRKVEQWPLPETRFTRYYLHADGTLSPEPPGAADPPTSYTYNPNDPKPTLGGNFQDPDPVVKGMSVGGPFDQRGRSHLAFHRDTLPFAMRPDVLVFQTPPLEQEVEVTGPIEVKLWAASSAVDTDFTAMLLDVHPPNEDYPEGFAMNLCEAIIRARFRNGFEREEFMEPGQTYEITIEPQPTSNRFLPGHRIRLDLSSSNFPLWDANRNTGEPLGLERRTVVAHNTIYHDADHPSHVILPIVPRS